MDSRVPCDPIIYFPGLDVNGCIWEFHPSHYLMVKRSAHNAEQSKEGFIVTAGFADIAIQRGSPVYVLPSSYPECNRYYSMQDPVPIFKLYGNEPLQQSDSRRAVKCQLQTSDREKFASLAESFDKIQLVPNMNLRPSFVDTPTGIHPFYPTPPVQNVAANQGTSANYTPQVAWNRPVDVTVPPPNFGPPNPDVENEYNALYNRSGPLGGQNARQFQAILPPNAQQPVQIDVQDFHPLPEQPAHVGQRDGSSDSHSEDVHSQDNVVVDTDSEPAHTSQLELREIVQLASTTDDSTQAVSVEDLAQIQSQEKLDNELLQVAMSSDSDVLDLGQSNQSVNVNSTPHPSFSITSVYKAGVGIIDGVPSQTSVHDSSNDQLNTARSNSPAGSYRIVIPPVTNDSALITSSSSNDNPPTVGSMSEKYTVGEIMPHSQLVKERSSAVNRELQRIYASQSTQSTQSLQSSSKPSHSSQSKEEKEEPVEAEEQIAEKVLSKKEEKKRAFLEQQRLKYFQKAEKEEKRKAEREVRKELERELEVQIQLENKRKEELNVEKDLMVKEADNFCTIYEKYCNVYRRHRGKHYALRFTGYGELPEIQQTIVDYFKEKMLIAVDLYALDGTMMQFFERKEQEYNAAGDWRLSAYCCFLSLTLNESLVARQDAVWLFSFRDNGFDAVLKNLYTFILYSLDYVNHDPLWHSDSVYNILNFEGIDTKSFQDYLERSVRLREQKTYFEENEKRLPSFLEVITTRDYHSKNNINFQWFESDTNNFLDTWIAFYNDRELPRHALHLQFLKALRSDIINFDISKLAELIANCEPVRKERAVSLYISNAFNDQSFNKFTNNQMPDAIRKA